MLSPHNRLHRLPLALGISLLAACGSADSARTTTPAPARSAPTRREIRRALAPAVADIAACLTLVNHSVTIRGALVGATGTFRLDDIEINDVQRDRVTQCIRSAAANVRVSPFDGPDRVVVREVHDDEVASTPIEPFALDAVPFPTSASPSPPPSSAGTVPSELDAGTVARVIRAHVRDVRICYERALRAQPTIWGRVVVHFTVSAAGQVTTSASTHYFFHGSAVGDATVGRCIAEVFNAMVFPPSDGSTDFSFPFNLMPGGTPSIPPHLSGRINVEAVTSSLRANRAALNTCAVGETDPTIGPSGRVMVQAIIDPEGRVVTSRPMRARHSDDPPTLAGNCLAFAIHGMIFPPIEGGYAAIAIPFVLVEPAAPSSQIP